MRRKGDAMPERYKTSLVIDRDLWIKLKTAAMEEGTDASALLALLAEAYLKDRKGSRR
jgi:hypothetical protein